ncbi:MAG: DUF1016 N-terminal domain-containing protein [Deltaproteobacteria bacterium]|nr:DUF1016 N-terminal domain-containing protein [Deltaproteobacteria bacterium]
MSLAIKRSESIQGFSSALSWSHYRTLTKVENKSERLFYEIEAKKEGWSVPVLERQIHSFLFARLLKSRDKEGVLQLAAEGQTVEKPSDTLKATQGNKSETARKLGINRKTLYKKIEEYGLA